MKQTPPMEPVVGVLLAGGLSRRIGGGDKCLKTLGGVSLIELAIARLRPQTDVIVLNANGDAARFDGLGLPVARDTIPGFAGPLAGILAGMLWARDNVPSARFVVTAACDTPFFPLNLVSALREALGGGRSAIAIAASAAGAHPTFGVWPVSRAATLEAAIAAGRRRLLDFVEEHNGIIVPFPPVLFGGVPVDPFLNINTPEDLSDAERLIDMAGQPNKGL